MKWEKEGRVITLEDLGGMNWGDKTHTQLPVPFILDDGNLRIYFSAREKGRSLPTFIDLEKDTYRILEVNRKPLIQLGKRGTFDEFGIMPSDVIKMGDEVWMYYVGWQLGISFTYTLAIGLAISHDNGKTFERAYEGPIFDRSKDEPYMTMAPFIVKTDEGWNMFYASGKGFIEEKGQYEPQYSIMSAKSSDGISWKRNGQLLILGKTEDESNTRPTIVKINNKYYMWFCYRGAHDFRNGSNSYQIGFAESEDLITWIRKDESVGISKSVGLWDGKMITYPYVIEIGDRYYMFYNGDGFGRTGIGYAILNTRGGYKFCKIIVFMLLRRDCSNLFSIIKKNMWQRRQIVA